jgi:hypothetical protein
MITEIEISPSGRARCKGCFKPIGEGTPRGVETESKNGHQEKKYFCFRCLPQKIEFDIEILNSNITNLKDLKDGLNKMIKENIKAVTVDELKQKE